MRRILANLTISVNCGEWLQSGVWAGLLETGAGPLPSRTAQLLRRIYPLESPRHPPGVAPATCTEGFRPRNACHPCFVSDQFPFPFERALPNRNREFSAFRLA